MKKRHIAATAGLLLVAGIVITTRFKSDMEDHREITIRAKNFVRRLNRRDYNACIESFDQEMRESMAPDQMKATFDPILDALGEFEAFRCSTVTMRTTDGPDYYRCALRCDYTEGSAEICLLFDHDLAISGVYVK